MERISAYKKAILEVMQEYADYFKVPDSELTYEFITDDARHHYQLVRLGWHQRKRVHVMIFHIDIIDGKIWIQQDNTEEGVANYLLEKGIQKSEIVLAYFSPEHREYTDFAVA